MTDLPIPKKQEVLLKSKTNLLLVGLPQYLKEPKNYLTVQKALLETLSCGKSHADPAEMLNCLKCGENMKKRRELMRKFGFKSPAQYMEWKKTHEEIKNRMPLDMYNRMAGIKTNMV